MATQSLGYFRHNLRIAMQTRGLTQRAVADAADVSYPYVNRILTSKAEPTLPICDRLAIAVDVPLATLLQKPAKKTRATVDSQ